jgi:transcriptional regulator with XRE-family HTH domain
MANAPTVSDLIAERLRGLLDDRKMTVRELAGRCKAAGMPKLTAQALYKLVGQRDRPDRPPRPVTVDELLGLAVALDVNPVYLICGLDDEHEREIPVTPEIRPSALQVWNWMQGLTALPGMDEAQYVKSLPVNMRTDYVRDPEGALALVDKRLGELASLRKDITEDIERRRGLQDRMRSVRGHAMPGGSEG